MLSLLTRLQALLSDRNTEYLEWILTVLTDESPLYREFWGLFQRKYPGQQANEAWGALRELLRIVQEQRGGK